MVLIINSLGRVVTCLKFDVSQKTNGVLSVRIHAWGVESDRERERERRLCHSVGHSVVWGCFIRFLKLA